MQILPPIKRENKNKEEKKTGRGKERTLPNILLFTIIISIDTLIHQNINIRNHKDTNYL